MRIRIKPTDKLPLELSPSERKLLLENVLVPLDLIKRIRLTLIKDGKAEFHFTLDELEELAGYIAAEAIHATSKKMENKLNKIYLRIFEIMDHYTDQEEEPIDGLGVFHRQLSGDNFPPKDLKYEIQPDLAQFAEVSIPELGDLSMVQVQLLLQSGWSGSNGAMQCNQNLSLPQLKGAILFNNTRALLAVILKADGVKLTQKGNLSRSFVRDLLDVLEISKDTRDRLFRVCKVINEIDCFEIHIPNILLNLAGLVRKYKGTLKITRKGRELATDANAGQLFNLLFQTFFKKLNLFYLTRYKEIQGYQATIAFPIYMSGQLSSSWVKAETVAHKVLLPDILAGIPKSAFQETLEWLVELTVFEPLVGFGLLEKRELPQNNMVFSTMEIRKSHLYDKFLKFNLDLPAEWNHPPSPKTFLH